MNSRIFPTGTPKGKHFWRHPVSRLAITKSICRMTSYGAGLRGVSLLCLLLSQAPAEDILSAAQVGDLQSVFTRGGYDVVPLPQGGMLISPRPSDPKEPLTCNTIISISHRAAYYSITIIADGVRYEFVPKDDHSGLRLKAISKDE